MRIFDYYETGDGVKVTHSDVTVDDNVLVFFDKGDRHLEVTLPEGRIVENNGFDDRVAATFLVSTVRGMKSIMEYARHGGVGNAWAV
ncbi:hypothetical protein [Bifidobacterium eulemuris]|uniref:Uncharacterized protein n=1 Tax=Bifidobacterium eulemuris TaxID=1765219 RepID=A0A7L9SMK7_9BIFI|nr:hypothetical protein [Bifidobacterium eulemuris]QOL31370.1 hypothetical protein BE0216_02015 [Bifidobacterium eulemuris]